MLQPPTPSMVTAASAAVSRHRQGRKPEAATCEWSPDQTGVCRMQLHHCGRPVAALDASSVSGAHSGRLGGRCIGQAPPLGTAATGIGNSKLQRKNHTEEVVAQCFYGSRKVHTAQVSQLILPPQNTVSDRNHADLLPSRSRVGIAS